MFIVGHCYVAERSGVFPEHLVAGDGIGALMLPDFVDCHDWGYSCWRQLGGRTGQLIRAHLVTDWVVHFGELATSQRTRIGWAYRRMRLPGSFYEEFFDRAHACGFRTRGIPNDTRRGFAHSMMEYSIDTCLCRRRQYDRWYAERGRQALTGIALADVLRMTADCDVPTPDLATLESSVASYTERAKIAREPEDLALLAACLKFGLPVCLEAAEFVRPFVNRILEEVPDDEVESVCRECSAEVGRSCSWPVAP